MVLRNKEAELAEAVSLPDYYGGLFAQRIFAACEEIEAWQYRILPIFRDERSRSS